MHHLSSVDKVKMTAICSICGPCKIVLKGKYGRECETKVRLNKLQYYKSEKGKAAARKAYQKQKIKRQTHPRLWNFGYRKFIKPKCEKCGFESIHICQLDIHHKDGDRSNNNESNLITLCPPCHRIEHLPEYEKAKLSGRVATKTPTAAPNGLESKGMESVGVSDVKKQLDEMTKCYEEEFKKAEGYMVDIGNLAGEVDRVAGFTEDDKVRYWRDRALVAEGKLKGKTNEFDQG